MRSQQVEVAPGKGPGDDDHSQRHHHGHKDRGQIGDVPLIDDGIYSSSISTPEIVKNFGRECLARSFSADFSQTAFSSLSRAKNFSENIDAE